MNEIERKFLLKDDSWREGASKQYYKQGYLSSHKERTVRVRIAEDKAFLTVKGKTIGMTRAEFEYAIPVAEARIMLDTLCEKPLIEKYRYTVQYARFVWEIDEFLGENEGLIVAEIELPTEDTPFALPTWAGKEVTTDARYYNANLIQNPYKKWTN
jgi:adenylate cyclase